jgi:UDP-N-acetylmuramyl pentapeptide phosphotransferase/UDP-N-acetylglucosamine-1-phosphate transferase
MDAPGAIQKVHARPTPRVGGVGIYLALVIAAAVATDADTARILRTLLIAGAPALFMGLLEDVTKKISVLARLAATFASGVLGCWMDGLALNHVDVPLLDLALGFGPFATVFTGFAVSGVANAINIIDGHNGLASGTTVIALLALAGIASQASDIPLTMVSVILAAAVAGFWLVNFPWGKLFLGDGGAYFAGLHLRGSPSCCRCAIRLFLLGPACLCVVTRSSRCFTASRGAGTWANRPASPTAATCIRWSPAGSCCATCVASTPRFRTPRFPY